jgi:hypothetical protein
MLLYKPASNQFHQITLETPRDGYVGINSGCSTINYVVTRSNSAYAACLGKIVCASIIAFHSPQLGNVGLVAEGHDDR